MGGIGKTHLLKQIQDSFYPGNSIFDVVILVTASRECSVAKVQDEIFKKLSLDKPTDVQLNAETISNFLTPRSFLLLVDDLWKSLDLKAVGVPIPLTASARYKRKVALTTRLDEVCGVMGVERQIKVDKLDEVAAWSLFQKNVSEQTLGSDPLILATAKKVAKKLGGLPLALITIGRSMHAKKDHRLWEWALELLEESRLHEIEDGPNAKESTTFHTLKCSYENLKSDDALRHCFLSCSMWPKDYKISKEELIRSWVGLGLVKLDGTVRSCYKQGYDLIDQLQAACLLEDSSSYTRDRTERSVQMHGVLRDMALWIARDYGENNNKWIVKATARQVENILSEAERISLMIMDKDEKMPFPYGTLPPLTKLTTLTLRGYELRVNIQAFDALTYLDLEDNSFHEFPVEICNLVKLQYLNLDRNQIKSLPEQLNSLINLKYLHLRNNHVETIANGAFSTLNALQVLDLFTNSVLRPSIGYPSSLLEELKNLNNLKALGITAVGESQFRPLKTSTNLPIQYLGIHSLKKATLPLTTNFLGNLIRFGILESRTTKILIQSGGLNVHSHLGLEILSFSWMPLETIVWKEVHPKDVFPNLQHLKFVGCNKLENVSWIVYLPRLWELKLICYQSLRYGICCIEDNHGESTSHL